jgi:hypothetical protein
LSEIASEQPAGITALAIFFFLGALISFTACLSLLLPGSFLEPMWQLNPRARHAFAGLGQWAIVLLGAVSVACAFSAAGLWSGRRWGYRLAIVLLTINLVSDVLNVALGTEPRAAIGAKHLI